MRARARRARCAHRDARRAKVGVRRGARAIHDRAALGREVVHGGAVIRDAAVIIEREAREGEDRVGEQHHHRRVVVARRHLPSREASRVVLGKRPFGCPRRYPTLSPPLRLSHPQGHRNKPDADVAEGAGQRREKPALEQQEAGRVRCENDGARGGGELAVPPGARCRVVGEPGSTASSSSRRSRARSSRILASGIAVATATACNGGAARPRS